MKFKILLLLTVLTLGIFLRVHRLDTIPPGLNPDEASIGYNAYSLLETGKDRYGQILPLTFRSLGSYILPVYTYLTIIPVAIFGPTIFSVHLVSTLSSILLLIITSLLVFKIQNITFRAKSLAMLFVSISPWPVFFGRAGYEISLSLALFAVSIFLFIKSISNPKWIVLTLLIAGLAGSTNYTERYLSLIFFPLSIWVFRDKFFQYKSYLIIGVLLLILSQLPNIILIKSEAFTRRIEQVNYLSDKSFNDDGGEFKYFPFGKALYILREFTSHYIEYFSPRSLFFEPDPQQGRSMPDLSVFYIWMLIPLWFGLKFALKNKSNPVFKILLLLLIVSPIPAALTRDPFYSTRALSFFWVLTLFISFGVDYLIKLIHLKSLGVSLSLLLVLISLVSLYNSYFILLKHERGDNYGYEYNELTNKLREYPDKKIVVDSNRVAGAHVWIPFYGKMDPLKYQLQTSDEIKNNYYNNTNLDTITKIDNFEIRPIFWENDIYEDKILVGDQLAISEEQIKEHQLTSLFQIIGLDGKIKLKAYKTDPKLKCEFDLKNSFLNPKCNILIPL